jgi:hypothetical protein
MPASPLGAADRFQTTCIQVIMAGPNRLESAVPIIEFLSGTGYPLI